MKWSTHWRHWLFCSPQCHTNCFFLGFRVSFFHDSDYQRNCLTKMLFGIFFLPPKVVTHSLSTPTRMGCVGPSQVSYFLLVKPPVSSMLGYWINFDSHTNNLFFFSGSPIDQLAFYYHHELVWFFFTHQYHFKDCFFITK